MLMLRMAFRNLLRHKRRTFLTVLTMLGGFVVAAVAIGWGDGTYHDVINMFTRNRLGHIQIHAQGYLDRPSLYKTIDDVPGVGDVLDQTSELEAWTARVQSAGLASAGTKTAAVRILGIDPEREDRATRFDRKLVQGHSFSTAAANEAILGRGLARILHAEIGAEVVIVSQGADGSIANDAYTVVGVVDSGDELADRTDFYLRLADAQELLVLDGRVHELVVVVRKLRHVIPVTRLLAQALDGSGLSVEPWQEFAEAFYRAMMIDRRGMWITLFVIILIVAVGVLNTVLMAVLERRREYGVLKALGTKPGQISLLILYEVNIMALVSILAGAVVALGINYWLSIHGLTLPEPISYGGMDFSVCHAEINLRSFVIPAITVALTGSLVGLFPAWQAGRTDPAAAMRTH